MHLQIQLMNVRSVCCQEGQWEHTDIQLWSVSESGTEAKAVSTAGACAIGDWKHHLLDHPEQGKLSTHCLATASRSGHQHAVIQVVQHIECLSLNGIEAPEALIQTFELCIPAYQHQAFESKLNNTAYVQTKAADVVTKG